MQIIIQYLQSITIGFGFACLLNPYLGSYKFIVRALLLYSVFEIYFNFTRCILYKILKFFINIMRYFVSIFNYNKKLSLYYSKSHLYDLNSDSVILNSNVVIAIISFYISSYFESGGGFIAGVLFALSANFINSKFSKILFILLFFVLIFLIISLYSNISVLKFVNIKFLFDIIVCIVTFYSVFSIKNNV